MSFGIASLASGSSGNCYLVKSNNTKLLVDAGISGKQIVERLKKYSVDEVPSSVLVTHEHSDHVLGLGPLLKKGGIVYGTEGTLDNLRIDISKDKKRYIKENEVFTIGDINIYPFRLSHDALQPVGYSFECEGKTITIVTDTGYVTDDCLLYMRKSDILVLESNHDVSMLRIGKYPYFLKQRILGSEGHLSNEDAANAVLTLLKEDLISGRNRKRIILLAHLSKENNFPQMAMATMSNILESENYYIGKDVYINILSRSEESKLFEI